MFFRWLYCEFWTKVVYFLGILKTTLNMFLSDVPGNILLLKVNNRDYRKRREICSKLAIRTPERRHWRRSGVFIVNFEYILHLFLVLQLLTLNKLMLAWFFCCSWRCLISELDLRLFLNIGSKKSHILGPKSNIFCDTSCVVNHKLLGFFGYCNMVICFSLRKPFCHIFLYNFG